MRRFAIFVSLIATSGLATAQPQPAAVQRPSFSPYLNLARGGNNPGINYLGVVRPQMQMQQQYGQLQQQLWQTNQNLQDVGNVVYGADPNLALSGHRAVFNNTGRYFNSNPAFGGVGGGLGSGRVSGGFPSALLRPGGGFSSALPRPSAGPTGGTSRPSMGARGSRR